MASSELYDLVIIGGGPGGFTAGIYAKRAVLKTALIEKGPVGGQMTLTEIVENWPGTERIPGMELSERFLAHALAYGLEVINQEATAIEPGLDYHTVRLADNRTLFTHAVIIATGGSPRKLGVPGEKEYYGKGVSYCAVCDGFFFRNKTVVVVGGGDSAVEEALYLAKLANKVYLVHRRDSLRAGMILQQRVREQGKIELIWNTLVKSIEADSSGVNAVVLENILTGEQRMLPTDGIFVFIGFTPNNQLVPASSKMDADGYVITDETCQTNIPGIFAIGDLRHKYGKQIVIAAGEGATAALAVAHYVDRKKGESRVATVRSGS
jgi:thioredoxin reductase (NADPH)